MHLQTKNHIGDSEDTVTHSKNKLTKQEMTVTKKSAGEAVVVLMYT